MAKFVASNATSESVFNLDAVLQLSVTEVGASSWYVANGPASSTAYVAGPFTSESDAVAALHNMAQTRFVGPEAS